MVSVPSICFSTILFDREGSAKDRSGESNSNVSSSSLANSGMVSSGLINVNNGSYFNSNVIKSFIEHRREESLSSSKPEITTDGLDSFRSKLETEGISKQASSLITASRRKGTTSHYESSWRKLCSWCCKEQVDSFSAPLRQNLNFLASLFQEGLQYNTIAGYRFAISAYHDPIKGFPVGQHPRGAALLTGVYNQRFPKPKHSFIWDVEIVIKFLSGLKSLLLSDKLLTQKLTMLLALTSTARAHEICYLNLKFLSRSEIFYSFEMSCPTKTSKQGKPRPAIKVYSFSNENLCVCKHIDLYVERTKSLRKGQDQLLLSYVSPHKPASTATVSRWLVNILQLSGIDTKEFSGHSVRSASVSKAKALGVSTKNFLQRRHWSKESTFQKYYCKEISINSDEFPQNILVADEL